MQRCLLKKLKLLLELHQRSRKKCPTWLEIGTRLNSSANWKSRVKAVSADTTYINLLETDKEEGGCGKDIKQFDLKSKRYSPPPKRHWK